MSFAVPCERRGSSLRRQFAREKMLRPVDDVEPRLEVGGDCLARTPRVVETVGRAAIEADLHVAAGVLEQGPADARRYFFVRGADENAQRRVAHVLPSGEMIFQSARGIKRERRAKTRFGRSE